MKNLLKISIFSLIYLAIYSFKENVQATPALLECKMDGALIKGQYPGVHVIYVPAKKEVSIMGKTTEGMISIIIDSVSTTGTYIIEGNSKNGAGVMTKGAMYEVKKKGTPFTVNIEVIEPFKVANAQGAKAIRGTFSGKLMDQNGKIVEITEGKFSSQ